MSIECPDSISHNTPDEIAECTDGITDATYRALWAVMSDARFAPRPLGGDGSNGTIEAPDDFSGSMADAWPLLSEDVQRNIVQATAADEKEFQELTRGD